MPWSAPSSFPYKIYNYPVAVVSCQQLSICMLLCPLALDCAHLPFTVPTCPLLCPLANLVLHPTCCCCCCYCRWTIPNSCTCRCSILSCNRCIIVYAPYIQPTASFSQSAHTGPAQQRLVRHQTCYIQIYELIQANKLLNTRLLKVSTHTVIMQPKTWTSFCTNKNERGNPVHVLMCIVTARTPP